MTTHSVILPMFADKPSESQKRYATIMADPPWHYELRAKDETHRARAPYGTMTQEELLQMPVGLWAQDRAHLYLWVTNAHMVQGHELAKAWGFEVKTIITWVKGRIEHGRLIEHMGTGNYYRGSTEHVLFAVRGSFGVISHDTTTAFIAPRGEHSEKPSTFYDMVEHMSPGPYLDVFSRANRFNWDQWGNEAFDFQEHGVFHHD